MQSTCMEETSLIWKKISSQNDFIHWSCTVILCSVCENHFVFNILWKSLHLPRSRNTFPLFLRREHQELRCTVKGGHTFGQRLSLNCHCQNTHSVTKSKVAHDFFGNSYWLKWTNYREVQRQTNATLLTMDANWYKTDSPKLLYCQCSDWWIHKIAWCFSLAVCEKCMNSQTVKTASIEFWPFSVQATAKWMWLG